MKIKLNIDKVWKLNATVNAQVCVSRRLSKWVNGSRKAMLQKFDKLTDDEKIEILLAAHRLSDALAPLWGAEIEVTVEG